MIRRWTPSRIIFELGNRTVTITGEGFTRPRKKPIWIGDLKALEHWDAPNGEQPISPEERGQIIDEICAENKTNGEINVDFQ